MCSSDLQKTVGAVARDSDVDGGDATVTCSHGDLAMVRSWSRRGMVGASANGRWERSLVAEEEKRPAGGGRAS